MRLTRILVVVSLVAAVWSPTVANASNNGPGSFAGTDHQLDDTPANSWGVTGLDPGSDNFKYNSLVFAIAQIGDRIYAGGKFLSVTNGTTTISRPYLAAFDADTGAWLNDFQPQINWSVFALEPSPDGSRLFVGGEFSSAGNGSSAAFAALDPVTGAIDPTFDVQVTREWSTSTPRVHALDVRNGWLYIGGAFSHVTGGGVRVQTSRLGRVAVDTGIADAAWRPQLTGGSVWAVEAAPAGDRVYAGGTFLAAGGTSSQAFAVLDTTSGSLVPGLPRDFGTVNFPINSGYVFVADIVVVGDHVWAGGQHHKLVQARASNLTVLRRYQTNRFGAPYGGGDFQAIALAGDLLFAGCHCWGRVRELNTSPTYERDVAAVLAFDVRTGNHVDTYAPEMNGADGAWALHVADDNCLWIGSDIHRSGGQPAYGLVRHCPAGGGGDASAPTAPGNLSGSWSDPAVELSWSPASDDVGVTGYVVERGGSQVATTTATRFTDLEAPSGATASYTVRATDAAGNLGPPATVTVSVGSRSGFACAVTPQVNGSVLITWNNLGANGYDVSHDGGAARWVTTTRSSDFSPGNRYTVVSWGNGTSGTTAGCDNPGGASGPVFTCSVTRGGGMATVSWTDIGANGYDVAHDGGAPVWIRTTTYVDSTPGTTYTIVAWGNGTSGSSATCS